MPWSVVSATKTLKGPDGRLQDVVEQVFTPPA